VRHYTFSIEDVTLIRQRRRNANRLGFAVHLAYLRFHGRVVQRLQSVRAIGVEPDRERRIHRTRYAAIARETAILSAQNLHRFDDQRRLATLVVFAREMEAELTDAALTMFDKMMGGVFCKADRRHKDNLVNRAKMLDSSARTLLGMAKGLTRGSRPRPLSRTSLEVSD
jgi:hypothetical protein